MRREGCAIGRSCQPWVKGSLAVTDFREIEIRIGDRRGAFYLPHDAWVEEVLVWAVR